MDIIEEHIPEYEPGELFERVVPTTPFQWYQLVLSLVVLIFVARLFDLQVVKGARNFFLAEGNRVREITKPAPRGVIFDRNGQPLIHNIVRFSVAVVPADLPKDEQAYEHLISEVAAIAGIDRGQLKGKLAGAQGFDPIVITDGISREQAIETELRIADLQGVVVHRTPTRQYPETGFSHVIGTVGKISREELTRHPDYKITDWIGKSGVELTEESRLKGRDGGTQVEVNARGQIIRLLGEVKPLKGADLKLTIDRNLQQAGMKVLSQIARKGGAIVALNPSTGEVLALGSMPEFDPNTFLGGDPAAVNKVFDDPNRPLINRAVAAAFPSGSAIKPIWATAALSEGTISDTTRLDTSAGAITIGNFTFHDWRTHGVADVRQAIAESNNLFFYAVSGGYDKVKGLGPDKLVDWARRFGLGGKTGIDLPGEVEGFLPTPEWKKRTTGERWYIGDSYNLGIGQGNLLVSPLQLARAAGAVATGKLAKPYLLQDSKPELKELGVKDEVLRVVREGMRLAVTSGSARQLADIKAKDSKLVEIAAKTGTAQAGRGDTTHGWMVAFGPFNDPQIVVAAFVEEGGEGHATAGPVVRAMLQEWFGR